MRYPIEDRFLFFVCRITGRSVDEVYRWPWVRRFRSLLSRL